MGTFDEREAIYEQMWLLIEERRVISKSYYDLKERLDQINKENVNQEFVEKNRNQQSEKAK